jgi:hypothetical protein
VDGERLMGRLPPALLDAGQLGRRIHRHVDQPEATMLLLDQPTQG